MSASCTGCGFQESCSSTTPYYNCTKSRSTKTFTVAAEEKKYLSSISKSTISNILLHQLKYAKDFTDVQRITGELIELIMESGEIVIKELENKQ